MKSRSASPGSPQVVRRYRVDSKEGATAPYTLRNPNLRIEELPALNMNGFQPFGTPSSDRESSPRPGLLGPIPNGVRRVSGEATPSRPILNGHTSSPSVPAISSPTPENDSPSTQWSSAIGHATTAGKSGRVIERLMAENDKLKRELELSMLRAQELEKTLATYKPQMDALRHENENLSHTSSVDSGLLARRERKIEELKADSTAKTERTSRAEALVRQQQRQIEELQEQHIREHQSMMDQTKHATVHAEILETSHKQLSAEYRARREAWERDLANLHEDRDQDRHRMARLDVVYEQMRQENERTKKVQAELVARWEEAEEAINSTLEEGDEVNEKARKKSVEMDQVVKEMKWLMGVKKSSSRHDLRA